MKEIWKKIEGYDNYEVSNLGRIRKLNIDYRSPDFHILKQKHEKNGYMRICLSKNGVSKFYNVHRLVAKAFIPNPNNYLLVNHKDENKTNNNVNNLEWCTYKYNALYGNTRLKRKVNQYDENMNLLNTYNSIKEASVLTNANRRDISQCCKKLYRKSNGFFWRYADE